MAIAAHVFRGVTGGCTEHSTSDRTGDGSDRAGCRTDDCTRDGTGAHAGVLAQVATTASVDVHIIVIVTHAVRGITARCAQHAAGHCAHYSANRSCHRRTDDATGNRSCTCSRGTAHRSVRIMSAFYTGRRHVLIGVVNDAIGYRISVI
jgi:hypothetical protein